MVAGHTGQVVIIYRLNKEKILRLLPLLVTVNKLLLILVVVKAHWTVVAIGH